MFIASLIYKGKHLTKLGKELIIKVSRRMNNYRLSSFKHIESSDTFVSPGGEEIRGISSNLVNEVINMKDIYVINQDGLRINSLTGGSLVKRQLFYILAEEVVPASRACLSSQVSEKFRIFKDSQSCADYFKIAPQTINAKLNKGVTVFDSNKVEFKLSRRPLR